MLHLSTLDLIAVALVFAGSLLAGYSAGRAYYRHRHRDGPEP